MTRAAFVVPWRSDRFVSPGLQNVCHLDLGLGCAKFVFFLVKCRPVPIHTFGRGPASVHVLEPFVGEDPCLMFVSIGCRTCFVGWCTFSAKWFCMAALLVRVVVLSLRTRCLSKRPMTTLSLSDRFV